MSTRSEEVCEEINDQCEPIDIELSSALSKTWTPVVVGKPIALFYMNDENFLDVHLFGFPGLNADDVLVELSKAEPSSEVVDQLAQTKSLVLHDPDDDFAVISNLEFSDLGLDDVKDE